MHSSHAWKHKWEICTALHRASSSLLHRGFTQHIQTHCHVSGAPEDTETLHLEASLLLGHSKGCPKGFLIQTHHFFPPVNGSYAANENSRKNFQQCQHSRQQPQAPLSAHTVLPTLRAAVACPRTPLAAHPPVTQHRHPRRHRCAAHEEHTGHNLDLSQGRLSSDHSSTRQVEHSSLWEWQV